MKHIVQLITVAYHSERCAPILTALCIATGFVIGLAVTQPFVH